ncbi:MAG TPA: SDR family oxidoreductase [Stellaceae bacterium]|nr:SDR family oxidoreductase [Stellaceae bacterium]
MDLQLKGRAALVTGASMGIGRAVARMLAAEGAKVAVVARRKPLLEELAAEIARAQDPAAALIVQDVMAPDAAQRIRDQAMAALGKVEILVNSAGGSRPLPIDAGDDSWDEAMTLNFTRVRQLTQALLDELAGEIKTAGGTAPAIIAQDIMAEDAATALAAAALRAVGHIDILVNNAGGSRPLPIDAPESAWEEALTLNFTRYRQVTQALLPQMIERGWGRIINITGKSEPEGLNAAFAAKAAVHAWAKGLSREIGKHGITVNCIPPGRIMSEQIRRNYPEAYREKFAEEEIPVGYWGEPEDLAVLAVFLASARARYITGAVIPVDGGLRRYQF